uniref:Uncharacterized protein n=1 Tax=Acrobeloides nanus TaxID=290746 RepID=A0A914CEN0_9BILA
MAISEFTPYCHAVPPQYRMLAPFWADVDIRNTGDVFYRQTTDETVLKQGEKELGLVFNDEENIQLKWAFLATWYNVTYFQDLGDTDEADRKRNTFQAALLTDGSQSFVIYYYYEVSWTTGDVSGGTDGLGGTAAEVGYDFGDGINRELINGSCTADILTIVDKSNVGSPGKWIFRTNQLLATPTPSPECLLNYTGDFCLVPNAVDTIGHTLLDITNIQLTSTESAICRFYDHNYNVTEVEAKVITLTHITCETPMFFSTGRLQMEIDILDEHNNGTNRTLAGYLYVTTPSDNAYKLNVNFLSNGSLYFTWNPSDINWGGTNSREKGVEDIAKLIFVHVCKKVVNGIDFCIKHPWFCGLSVAAVVLVPEITVPEEIIGGLIWTPAFAMDVKDGTLDELCNTDPDEGLCTSTFYMTKPDCEDITSANCPRPLAARGKDAQKALADLCNAPDPDEICKKLLGLMGINENLDSLSNTTSPWPEAPTDIPACPPTLDLAMLDPLFVVDPDCPGNLPCTYNPGVDLCYISAVPSPSGGAQHCCYLNRQIYIKAPGAGYPFIAHPSIAVGIPHIALDLNPYTYCCQLEGIDPQRCNQLVNGRGPDPGSNYTSPGPSLGNGDPHFTTFDGLYYNFNGAGEFWLLKNSSVQPIAAQTRMTLPNGLASSYSWMTSYAFKSDNSSVVQIEITESCGDNIGCFHAPINVYYDRVPIPENIWKNTIVFDDVTISYDNLASGYDQREVIVSFGAGISFKISTFSVTTFVNAEYKGNFTHGLLGSYDGNPFNDFESPDGVIIPANSTTEIIHYKFGLKWYVEPNESLFDYFGKNYSDFYFPQFKPSFEYAPGQLPPNAEEICGDDESCLWDLVMTGNAEVANETREKNENFNNTVTTTSQNITMCSKLQTFDHGSCFADNYLPNSIAQCKCDSGYELNGAMIIGCKSDGAWNSTEPNCDLIITSTEELTTGSCMTSLRGIPSTFPGSPRFYSEYYEDAMALVRRYGMPNFFHMMICNPNWPEIKEALRHEFVDGTVLQQNSNMRRPIRALAFCLATFFL